MVPNIDSWCIEDPGLLAVLLHCDAVLSGRRPGLHIAVLYAANDMRALLGGDTPCKHFPSNISAIGDAVLKPRTGERFPALHAQGHVQSRVTRVA